MYTYSQSFAAKRERLTSQQVLVRQQQGRYRSGGSYRKTTPTKRSHWRRYIITAVLLAVLIPVLALPKSSDAAIVELRSGVSGYCMDDYRDNTAANTVVDVWRCNGSGAQGWVAAGGAITHDTTYCLSVLDNAKAPGSKLVANTCDTEPGQVWFAEKGGYLNPNSGLCLSAPPNTTNSQLILGSCDRLGQADEAWYSTSSKPGANIPSTGCGSQVGGQKIACIAEQQWTDWQNNPSGRPTLLDTYSDGNGYEEWCADLISYVYKKAGQPFSNGERAGWDEYNANTIQYQGFTKHWAGDYIPKTGDIAFFNYPGGHVELVASGGKTPTFIYGDSANRDPVTGNGNMATNTLTSDGSLGQVIYYLSPNND